MPNGRRLFSTPSLLSCPALTSEGQQRSGFLAGLRILPRDLYQSHINNFFMGVAPGGRMAVSRRAK
jgi:hypothetical protein